MGKRRKGMDRGSGKKKGGKAPRGGSSGPKGKGTRGTSSSKGGPPIASRIDLGVTEGRLRTTRDGRPLVVPDDPSQPAVRVSEGALGGAWPKDRVRVKMSKRRGFAATPQGEVVKVVERGLKQFVGRLGFSVEGRAFVRFRDRDSDLVLPVDLPKESRGEGGELVLVQVTEYPQGTKPGRGRVLRVMGKEHTMETLVLAVVAVKDLPTTFSQSAEDEAQAIHQDVKMPTPDADGGVARADRRDLPFVTIDGDDARDFDDAVCLVTRRGVTHLLVAIADVSHYVDTGGPIDIDAYARGTSVYFPDRCIPMLPRPLSEGVCSLRPFVDRLAVTADIPLDRHGRPDGAPTFELSLIRSQGRLTYDDVHAFLDGGEPPRDGAGGRVGVEIGAMLKSMVSLAEALSKVRSERGGLEFDLPEPKVEVEDGMPVRVRPYPRYESHRLIEEFMLLANTAVAVVLSGREIPFLYRIHEEPAEERVEQFEEAASRLLKKVHVAVKETDIAKRLQAWADAARGTKLERHVNMMMLRTLMLARYGPEDLGHFGLALSKYAHFTSPIRRYPDLLVHRVLKNTLGDRRYDGYVEALETRCETDGTFLSSREREATDAEREVDRRARALLMTKHIGKTFTGTVSSMTNYGFFAELSEQFVDGYVHMPNQRDDTYRYSADMMEWVGNIRGVRIGLGDRIGVRVLRADPDRGDVDLVFLERLP